MISERNQYADAHINSNEHARPDADTHRNILVASLSAADPAQPLTEALRRLPTQKASPCAWLAFSR